MKKKLKFFFFVIKNKFELYILYIYIKFILNIFSIFFDRKINVLIFFNKYFAFQFFKSNFLFI